MNFKKRKFDLHIIDALESTAAAEGRSEALAIRYHLRDTSIPIISHYAWDKNSLAKAVKTVAEYDKQYASTRKRLPFLHITSHGIRDGLLVGDDIPITWESLLEMLLPLQKKVDYTLPLTLSSCHGFWGYRLALQEKLEEFGKKNPCNVLIGPQNSLTTRELIASTASLYKSLLSDGQNLKKAIPNANRFIEDPTAHLAYIYGTNAVSAFEKHGVDDHDLFRPKYGGSKSQKPHK